VLRLDNAEVKCSNLILVLKGVSLKVESGSVWWHFLVRGGEIDESHKS